MPIRKRLLSEPHGSSAPEAQGEIDLASCATIAYSAEDADHPIERLIDTRRGRGGTYWASGRSNETSDIVVEFDSPQPVSCLIYEVEESRLERTQEVRVAISCDQGRSYRQILVQEYTFSPLGATFQREELHLELPPLTHLRLTIVPNKNGSGVATLTSLRLFA